MVPGGVTTVCAPTRRPLNQSAGVFGVGGSGHKRTLPPGTSDRHWRGQKLEPVAKRSTLCLSNPCWSRRRLSNGSLDRDLQATVVRQTLRARWRLEKSVPGLWCRVQSLLEAGDRRICWPAARDRVTRGSFGRRRRGAFWLSPVGVGEGFLAEGTILSRRRGRKEGGGGRTFGKGGGQGRPFLAGRRAQDRVAPRPPRPPGGWRAGSPAGWVFLRPPAGVRQGHPKMFGRRATARVAPCFGRRPLAPPPPARHLEASGALWAALGTPVGVLLRRRRVERQAAAAAAARWHTGPGGPRGCKMCGVWPRPPTVLAA